METIYLIGCVITYIFTARLFGTKWGWRFSSDVTLILSALLVSAGWPVLIPFAALCFGLMKVTDFIIDFRLPEFIRFFRRKGK